MEVLSMIPATSVKATGKVLRHINHPLFTLPQWPRQHIPARMKLRLGTMPGVLDPPAFDEDSCTGCEIVFDNPLDRVHLRFNIHFWLRPAVKVQEVRRRVRKRISSRWIQTVAMSGVSCNPSELRVRLDEDVEVKITKVTRTIDGTIAIVHLQDCTPDCDGVVRQ